MKDKKNIFEKLGLVEQVDKDVKNDETEIVLDEKVDDSKDSYEQEKMETKSGAEGYEASPEVSKKQQPKLSAIDKRLMSIEEVYRNNDMDTEINRSLFIIEKYLKDLPEYLPSDTKRQTVLSIVKSTGLNIKDLTTDGYERLNYLKDFSAGFQEEMDAANLEYEKRIEELKQEIEKCNKVIKDIKNLKKEQTAVVDYEILKINDILEFVSE